MYTSKDLELFENKIDDMEHELIKRENELLEPTFKTLKELEQIVYNFVKEKKRKIYGGYAQNKLIYIKNKEDAFYPEDQLADIDFYSPNPIEDAMELVNIIIKKGYNYVQASEAFHNGTYSVFAEHNNVADISYVPKNIYHRMPFIEIDGVNFTAPSFIMIDMFRMISDPLTSGTHRWKKIFPRIVKLQKHYPFNKATAPLPKLDIDIPNDIKEIHNAYLKTTFDFLKTHNTTIVVGNPVYNYYLNISNILKDNKKKIYKLLDIPYFEFISINYKDDGKELYNMLRALNPDIESDISITEYYPFWQFLGYSAIIKYKDYPIAHIIHYNRKCTPITSINANMIGFNLDKSSDNIQIGTYDVNFLVNLIIGFKYRVNKDEKHSNYSNIMASHLIDIRNYYLEHHKKTIFDDTPFKEYTFDCIGKTMNPLIETRILRDKRKKSGKNIIWRYSPEKNNLKEPSTTHIFMNSSGNEVRNIKNLKIIQVDYVKDSDKKNDETDLEEDDIDDIDL